MEINGSSGYAIVGQNNKITYDILYETNIT